MTLNVGSTSLNGEMIRMRKQIHVWFNDFSLWFTVFSCPFLVLFFMICYAFSYCFFLNDGFGK